MWRTKLSSSQLWPFLCVVALLISSSSCNQDPEDFQLPSNAQSRVKRGILQNFAMERALKDKGFVRSLIYCVLDKGPCDRHGRQLRLMAPEIVRGRCPGCSKKVHGQIRRVISHVQRNFPQEWSEVTRRFLQYPQQQLQNVFGGYY